MATETETRGPAGRALDKERALDDARREAKEWRGCVLAEAATQFVFGDGPATAELMFIGEAPGYHEDKQGIPFVGPAGRLLAEAFERARDPSGGRMINREDVYVTNVEKFRPWLPVGKMGKNRQPKQSEINACRPWLEREIAIVQPRIICCLGAVAAKWVLGKDFKLTQQRGEWHSSQYAPNVLATLHPAYVLIQPEESREQIEATFFGDIQAVADRLRHPDTAAA
jgi:DNA polymerase